MHILSWHKYTLDVFLNVSGYEGVMIYWHKILHSLAILLSSLYNTGKYTQVQETFLYMFCENYLKLQKKKIGMITQPLLLPEATYTMCVFKDCGYESGEKMRTYFLLKIKLGLFKTASKFNQQTLLSWGTPQVCPKHS